MPVGKPAPPRPRSPDCVTIVDGRRGPDLPRPRQALQPAMRPIVLERQRIDDAAAGKGQPRLAREERQSPPAARGATDAAPPASMPAPSRPEMSATVTGP